MLVCLCASISFVEFELDKYFALLLCVIFFGNRCAFNFIRLLLDDVVELTQDDDYDDVAAFVGDI